MEREVVTLKRVSLVFAVIVLFALVFCGCQVQLGQSDSHSVNEESAVPEWKTAYLDFLEIQKDSHVLYGLVYIDDDDIPELYLSGDSEATGDSICTYKNGNVIHQQLNRIGGGRYIARSGDIINQNGNMGHIYTHVYRLEDGKFDLVFSALFVEKGSEYLDDDNYEFSFEYSVEGKSVSEDAYHTAIADMFDFAQSVRLDENAATYDMIRQQIMNCK